MNHKSIHISIPTPCHESWSSMDETARGAFCHSCQKEVIDFSAMTDREVIEYLSKHKTGCGRFRNDQVNTKLSMPRMANGFMKWKALFLSILPLLSFRAAMAGDLGIKPQTQQKAIEKETVPSTITVSGHVSNEAGEAINEGVVEVVDSAGEYIGPSVMLEQDGCFTIVLNGQAVQQGARLKVIAAAYKGYQSEIQILSYEPFQDYSICLMPMVCEVKVVRKPSTDGGMVGMMVVVETVKQERDYSSPIFDMGFEYPKVRHDSSSRLSRKDY